MKTTNPKPKEFIKHDGTRAWCVKHPRYRAIRKPQCECQGCTILYLFRDNNFMIGKP